MTENIGHMAKRGSGMRIIIGCRLAAIFSASCFLAATPVFAMAQKPAPSDRYPDYGALVEAEIERTLKAPVIKPSEINISVSNIAETKPTAPPTRKPTILPAHRSFSPVPTALGVGPTDKPKIKIVDPDLVIAETVKG